MPVMNFISPAELLLPRPVEAVAPLPPTHPAPETIAIRPTAPRPAGSAPERPATRDAAPAEERRQRVDAIARRNEQRVENEAIQETSARLDELSAKLDRVEELATRAGDAELNDEERAELLRQAREFAGQTEEALPPSDPFQRPAVATLATIALRPEILALADTARVSRDAPSDAALLQTRAVAARSRIEQIQRDILRPEQRRADFSEEATDLAIEERDRIQNPADASRVASEIRAESRVNAGEMLLSLANVLPQNALSLLAAI